MIQCISNTNRTSQNHTGGDSHAHDTENPHINAVQALTRICKEHYMEGVNKNVNTIMNDGHAIINGVKHECPIKYLEHEIASPAHEFVDTARLNKGLTIVSQKIQQIEMQKQLDHGMSM